VLRSFWPLWIVFPLLPACDGWEIFPSDAPALGPEPYVLSILNTESCPLPDGLDPKAVSIVSYNVRLRGQHPQKVPANYFYASLLTSDGSRYLADFPGCAPLLSAPPVGPGQTAQGYLNFPVPPGKVPEKLVYAPELTGSPKGGGVIELLLNQKLPDEPEAP
jgi:hypothetical protein